MTTRVDVVDDVVALVASANAGTTSIASVAHQDADSYVPMTSERPPEDLPCPRVPLVWRQQTPLHCSMATSPETGPSFTSASLPGVPIFVDFGVLACIEPMSNDPALVDKIFWVLHSDSNSNPNTRESISVRC